MTKSRITDKTNDGALASRAMLASLTVHKWLATRTDKKITAEVAERYSVEERRAGRFRKYAIDITHPVYAKVGTLSGALREKHYFHTLPWGQEGSRILLARNFQRYSKEIREAIGRYDEACAAFCKVYPQLKEAAKAELGEMFNDKDYPLVIDGHFGASLRIMPLPDAGDFRAQLAKDEVEQIRSEIAAELDRTTTEAMREPYERLYKYIARMAQQLGDPKGQIRDSLVGNLEELCGVLPALNLTNDPQLDALCVKARALTAHTPKELRDDSRIRAQVAEEAARIQDLMAGFMGPQS